MDSPALGKYLKSPCLRYPGNWISEADSTIYGDEYGQTPQDGRVAWTKAAIESDPLTAKLKFLRQIYPKTREFT